MSAKRSKVKDCVLKMEMDEVTKVIPSSFLIFLRSPKIDILFLRQPHLDVKRLVLCTRLASLVAMCIAIRGTHGWPG